MPLALLFALLGVLFAGALAWVRCRVHFPNDRNHPDPPLAAGLGPTAAVPTGGALMVVYACRDLLHALRYPRSGAASRRSSKCIELGDGSSCSLTCGPTPADRGTVKQHLALYEAHGFEVQCRHLGKPLLYAITETGPQNTYVHIWAYADAADRAQRRAAMAADPEWVQFLKLSNEAGNLIAQENRLLTEASFFDPRAARKKAVIGRDARWRLNEGGRWRERGWRRRSRSIVRII